VSQQATPKAYSVLPFLADPKREAEDARLQEIRRASFTRGRLTEAEKMVARGIALQEIAQRNLELVEKNRAEHLATPRHKRRKGKVVGELNSQRRHAERQLAEGLHLVGRHREASEVHPDKVMKEHYTEVAEAIDRDDEDECSCPPQEFNGQKIDHIRPARMVYSEKHNDLVVMERCVKCRLANARPPSGTLATRLAEHAAKHVQKESREIRR